MIAISLKQEYLRYARQAALAAPGSNTGGCLLKYVVVVDEDIEPSNSADALRAIIASRSDPQESIEVLRGLRRSQTDPIFSPFKRGIHDFTHSTAIIMACKLYHWIKGLHLVPGPNRNYWNRPRRNGQHPFE